MVGRDVKGVPSVVACEGSKGEIDVMLVPVNIEVTELRVLFAGGIAFAAKIDSARSWSK